jgi:hypothetical protein
VSDSEQRYAQEEVRLTRTYLRYAVICMNNGKYLILGRQRKAESFDSMMEYVRNNALDGHITLWVKSKTILMTADGGEPPHPWTMDHRKGSGFWDEMLPLFEIHARML